MDAESRRPLGHPKPHAPRPRHARQRLAPRAASALPAPEDVGGPTLPAWRCRPRSPHRPAPHAPWNGLTGPRREHALARDALRRFLRAYPRSDARAIFEAPGPRGRAVGATRAQLSQFIDTRLHPRQRQVVRLGIEERWARARVRAHLKGISTKTYERDQQEALDTLLAAIGATGEGEGERHHA